jgi:N-acetyl-gamma-glutamyl-phosphate reductase
MTMPDPKLRIAVFGASGYSGAELVRLLSRHPRVRVTHLAAASSAGKALSELYPALRGIDLPKLQALEPETLKGQADLAFLALPHTESMKAAPKLLAAGLKVIDLSGDFRLQDTDDYEAFYKHAHEEGGLLKEAVYGLAEIHGEQVKGARLVANPGCYTTTAILALYPLLKDGLISPEGIVIDAKSGVTGAGRKLQDSTAFGTVDGNFSAYRVGGSHQHIPEIEQELSVAAGKDVTVVFTPHLLPLNRGILSTAYAGPAKALKAEDLVDCLKSFYAGRPFVRVLEPGQLPTLRSVVGTNLIEIGAAYDERAKKVIIFSATDNLVKGAAGQAVQNLNLMFGWPETDGLDLTALPV